METQLQLVTLGLVKVELEWSGFLVSCNWVLRDQPNQTYQRLCKLQKHQICAGSSANFLYIFIISIANRMRVGIYR